MKSRETILNSTRKYRRTAKGVLTNSYHKQIERCKQAGKELPSYSLEELHNRFLRNTDFLLIYYQWVGGGYKYYDKPSIDRIDNTKGYTMENIQMLTWQDNRHKGDIENSHITTEVIQCTMGGGILARFMSMKEAVKLTGCHQSLISACCRGKRKQTGGYRWQYGDYKRK